MMDALDDRLDEAARALGERLPEIDASMDDRVMAKIRAKGAISQQPRRLPWLLEPQPLRVRPIWAALAAAAVLALLIVPRVGRDATMPRVATVATPDTIYVHFTLQAPSAQAVAVAGSFNNWNAAELPLRHAADGTWEATIALPVGEHRYQFVVDGQRWIPDPAAHAQVDDGFGGTNSVIVVGPKGVVRS